ncbi:Uncharacterized conserved protein [Plasmopara halstedii]|uniref:Uncharacterized conserved protein n=1 Tax=Plasmopara halstedii TaxID=4781 RepID=A0A0P1A9F4_PLAHL|nr:Uncharacterized conserved protein [Plasmopara halstedii]CEG37335.1 Uncharacterized conserved protein [Plasmopara halstedii]|eukprot:XP_024573704.1 Uncharacterized conserved protein [Plasmopara halstedii]
MAVRKGKKASSSKAKPRRQSTKHHKSNDVFSDDEKEATHQEQVMNARADVNEVFEYEEPSFDQGDSEVEDEQGGDLLSDLLGTAPASRLSTGSEEDNDEDKIKNLSEMVDSLVEKKSKKKLEEIDAQFANITTEGELTLGALLGAEPLNSGGVNAEEEVDEKTQTGLDMRRMRQQVRELEGDGTTLLLRAHSNPVQDARAQRKLAYVEKSKEVDVFEPVVQQNRKKETLDFRIQASKLEKLTPAVLANKFVAQTDMEKSVANLLQAGDLSDRTVAKDEEEELARKHVSVQEVAARQKELAKLRSLLFYDEQKKKRVKKIKSKLYHKIRIAQDKKAMARQKEELRALDPELARKLDEELAAKRAEERLTLKHRNTSKWVKHQLSRGIQADDATRSAIADQLRRGEELRQIDEDSVEASKKRGLQAMKFMQRAAEKQREKARNEAEKLLREIRTIDGVEEDCVLSEGKDYESSGEEGNVVKMNKKIKVAPKKVVVTEQDKAAVANALAGGAYQTKNVSMTTGVSARASGAIAINLGEGSNNVVVADGGKKEGNSLELGAKAVKAKTSVTVEVQAKTDSEDIDTEFATEGKENPWLSGITSKRKRSKKNMMTVQANKDRQVDVAAAIESLAKDTMNKSKDCSPTTSIKNGKKRKLDPIKIKTEAPAPKKKNTDKKDATQDELVRRAFEFVADTEDELAQEKDRLAGQDANAKKGAEIAKLVGMSGWGSWAGDGVSVSKNQIAREQKAKNIAREAKEKALAGRKDARLKHVLINERKDKKAAKFMLKDVPYPFTSRQEYEAAMRNPLGSDWNTSQVTNVLTAPKIMKHAGTAIAPLKLSKEDRKFAKKELSLKRKAKF